MKGQTKRELVEENARLVAEIKERHIGVEAQYVEMENLKARIAALLETRSELEAKLQEQEAMAMALYREKELLEDDAMSFALKIDELEKVVEVARKVSNGYTYASVSHATFETLRTSLATLLETKSALEAKLQDEEEYIRVLTIERNNLIDQCAAFEKQVASLQGHILQEKWG